MLGQSRVGNSVFGLNTLTKGIQNCTNAIASNLSAYPVEERSEYERKARGYKADKARVLLFDCDKTQLSQKYPHIFQAHGLMARLKSIHYTIQNLDPIDYVSIIELLTYFFSSGGVDRSVVEVPAAP
jgi:hypothetical protein